MKVWNVIEEATDPYEGSDFPLASYFEQDHAVMHVLLLEQQRDAGGQGWAGQTWRVDEDYVEESEPRVWEWWVGTASVSLDPTTGDQLAPSLGTFTRPTTVVRYAAISVGRPVQLMAEPMTQQNTVQARLSEPGHHWIHTWCVAETESEAIDSANEMMSKAIERYRAKLAKKKVSFS